MTEEIIIDGVDVAGCAHLVTVTGGESPFCRLDNFTCEGETCYYKRLKRLKQENKELKEEIQSIKSYLGIESKTILERLEELDEWKHNDKLLLWKYRSALEEINLILDELKQQYDYMTDYSEIKEIQDKINEVLNDN